MAQEVKNKKKFNWVGFIILLLVMAGLGALIWYIWFNKAASKSYSDFNQRYNAAKADTKDNKYFKEIKIDENYKKIYVVEHDGNKDISYWVYAPSSAQIYDLSRTIIGDTTNKLVGNHDAFMSGSKDYFADGGFKGTLYKAPSIWPSLMLSFLPMLLFIGFFIWMAKKQGGGGGNSPFSVGNNKARKMISDKKFSDIAGNEEVKEEVMEVVDYLKNPAKYKSAGAKIPKGILLGGPPGTGKTLLAKATAGEAGVPFYFISASNFVEMFVGVGAKRVREMFREARKNAPCIIFIDELDAVGRSRGAGMGGGNDEREQTLNQLLVEMDGMADNNGLLVLAATNRPDVLDPALQRPGRFDRTVTVGLPDVRERAAILEVHAKGKRIDKAVNFKQVAKRTPGYSGAQLESVINEAALLAVRENSGVITADQIDEAIDRVMAGPAKKSRVISKEDLTMVAHHEAGHAVIGIKVPGGQKVQKITIIPRGQAGGYNLMTPEKESYYNKKSDLLAQIASFMGGRAAEKIMYGEDAITNGASNDIEKATRIARAMVTQWGMSELGPIQYEADGGSPFLGRDYMKNKDFSDAVGHEIDQEVRRIIAEAQAIAEKTINENMDLLKAIASALLEKETIVAEEIEYIVEHGKLPEKVDVVEKKKTEKKSLKDLIAEVKPSKAKKAAPKKEAEEKEEVVEKKEVAKATPAKKAPAKKSTTTKKAAPKKEVAKKDTTKDKEEK
ncbi:ATP-dependent zinc metalloprotease FtsH [Mycoplasma todarodis]|uniref:ATP-dependent zinc metalloprotease FtsH n=1 Tax=Mycoplasma todarodis TaxID=1937191 RepID=UPI003B36017F